MKVLSFVFLFSHNYWPVLHRFTLQPSKAMYWKTCCIHFELFLNSPTWCVKTSSQSKCWPKSMMHLNGSITIVRSSGTVGSSIPSHYPSNTPWSTITTLSASSAHQTGSVPWLQSPNISRLLNGLTSAQTAFRPLDRCFWLTRGLKNLRLHMQILQNVVCWTGRAYRTPLRI